MSIFDSPDFQVRKLILSIRVSDTPDIKTQLWTELKSIFPIVVLQKKDDWIKLFENIKIYMKEILSNIRRHKKDFKANFSDANIAKLDKEEMLDYIKALQKSLMHFNGEMQSIVHENHVLSIKGTGSVSVRPLSEFQESDFTEAVTRYSETFMSSPTPNRFVTKREVSAVSSVLKGYDGDIMFIDGIQYNYHSVTPQPEYVDEHLKPYK